MIQLYDYQNDIISQLRDLLTKFYRCILIQSPTGSGKTVIFSHIISEMQKKGKRALIVTDRYELLTETGGTLEKFGLKPYHILAGQMCEPPLNYQVYVAMSQTLRRRIGLWPTFFNMFDVVIFDECHKQEFNPYFEQNAFPKKTKIFGFSATPVRIGKQRQLSEDYQVMIEGLQVPELIKRGKLVKDHYYSVEGVELSGAKYNSEGDYAEGWMFDKFNKTELYSGAVENWRKICPDTSTLVFCVNIQHVIETCKAFNNAGIKAKFLVSEVAKPVLVGNSTEAQKIRHERKLKEYENYIEYYRLYSGSREKVVGEWKRNEYYVLVNAGILTTGFNRKDLQTVIINRATTSVALWLQMIGRGSRPYPGKEYFNILDFGLNAKNLGYYNQMRKWSLNHEIKEGGGAIPVKECGKDFKPDEKGNTGCQSHVFVSIDICPYCGYIFAKEKKQNFAELVKIDYLDNLFPSENTVEDWFKELERTAESRGYLTGWVLNQIIAKHGKEGLKQYASMKNYKGGWYWQTKQRYQKQIDSYEEKHQQIQVV